MASSFWSEGLPVWVGIAQLGCGRGNLAAGAGKRWGLIPSSKLTLRQQDDSPNKRGWNPPCSGQTTPCCSVAKSCPTLCNPMNCSTPALHVLLYLPEFAQTHVHWVSNAIQPPHPLSSPSPPAFNLCQHQGLFQWVDSSHYVARVLELQLQL